MMSEKLLPKRPGDTIVVSVYFLLSRLQALLTSKVPSEDEHEPKETGAVPWLYK